MRMRTAAKRILRSRRERNELADMRRGNFRTPECETNSKFLIWIEKIQYRGHRERSTEDKEKNQAERKMSQRSSALKKRMVAAMIQARMVMSRELANSPIFERSAVN